MDKLFINYSGNIESFKRLGLEETYKKRIVFIEKDGAIYTHNAYYAGPNVIKSIQEALNELQLEVMEGDYVSSIKQVNGKIEATMGTFEERDSKILRDSKSYTDTFKESLTRAIALEYVRATEVEKNLSERINNHLTIAEAELSSKADKDSVYDKDQIDLKLTGVYKIKGSCTFENLPKTNKVGDVYNITNSFTLDGEEYTAGTNIVYTENGWDTLAGIFDTSELESEILKLSDSLAQESVRAIKAEIDLEDKINEGVIRALEKELELDKKFDNYLPLSGGIINSPNSEIVNFKSSTATPKISITSTFGNQIMIGKYNDYTHITNMHNGDQGFELRIYNDGKLQYGKGTSYEILRESNYANYALPLSGGTLTGTSGDILSINRTSGYPLIQFKLKDDIFGYIGVNTNKQPIFVTHDSVYNKIWHEGNFNPDSYLLRTGGTISKDVDLPIIVLKNTKTMPYVLFMLDTTNSFLGTSNGELKYLRPNDSEWNIIWHSGNDGEGSGLDADTLDGLQSTNFVLVISKPSLSSGTNYDLNSSPNLDVFIHDNSWSNSPLDKIGSVINIVYQKDWKSQLAFYHGHESIFYRGYSGSKASWYNWRQIAFTDSDITGNAATATKLQTPVKLWGNEFDGSSDVSGYISRVTTIYGSETQAPYLQLSSVPLNGTNLGGAIGIGVAPNNYGIFAWGTNDGDGHIQVGRKDGTGEGVSNYNLILLQFGGNISIGTTNTGHKLSVYGRIYGNMYNAFNSSAGAALILNKGGDYFGIGPSSVKSTMSFGAVEYAGTWKSEFMSMSAEGNIGIGTTNPLYRLDVNDTARIGALVFHNHNEINAYSNVSNDTSTNLHLNYKSNGNVTLAVGGGNVGIGTNYAPLYKLDVNGSIHTTDSITLDNTKAIIGKSTSGTSCNLLSLNGYDTLNIGYGVASNGCHTTLDGYYIYLRYGASHTTGMLLTSTGNVGMGTNDPLYKLDVAGTIKSSSNLRVTAELGTTIVYPWGIDINADNPAISFMFGKGGEITSQLIESSAGTISCSSKFITRSDLESGGHIKSASHIYIPNNYSFASYDTDGNVNRILKIDKNNYLMIGLDTASLNQSTYINGKAIHFRYSNQHLSGMILNESGNVTIGNSNLAGNSYKLYVDGLLHTNSLSIQSDTKVDNLNADKLDGYEAEDFALKSDVEVDVENGVYIVDLNGNPHDPNTFAGTADDVTGIGLVTDNGKWIVAIDEWYSGSESTAWNGNTYSAWGGYRVTVTDCFLNYDKTQALLDFNGEANTDAIISQLKDTTDDYSHYYTGAPAAEYCRAYSKGYKGVGEWYLPAAGELNEIALNKDVIDAILTKLGKYSLSKNSITWSSSQLDSRYAWCYIWGNSRWHYDTKRFNSEVRPVCKLELKKSLKEKVSELEISKKMLDNITYSELVTLRNNSQLVPGKQYRITDYITTTTQAETQSAGHLFDVIVIADTKNILNETARITSHEGDTYFANERLETFLIKYCLDNDTSRFSWADTANGKGVIYYMKDQHNNETPYDFKNIQFKRYKVLLNNEYCVDYKSYIENDYVGFKPMNSTGASMHPDLSIADESDFKWYYTFSRLTDETDASINSEGKVHDNVILPVVEDDDNLETYALNNIVFINDTIISENKFNDCCFLMTFIGDKKALYCNYIGSYSRGNILKNCLQNYISNNFQRNIIMSDNAYSNTIGLYFTENIAVSPMIIYNDFGDSYRDNISAATKEISNNKFYAECQDNIIVTTGVINRNHTKAHFLYNVINCSNFSVNTIEFGFSSNMITGGNFVQNIIGHMCQYNTFGDHFMNSVVGTYFTNNTFKTGIDTNSEYRRVSNCYFGLNIRYNNFYNDEPNTDYIKNLKVQSELKGTESAINNIEVPCNAINEVNVVKKDSGDIVVFSMSLLLLALNI